MCLKYIYSFSIPNYSDLNNIKLSYFSYQLAARCLSHSRFQNWATLSRSIARYVCRAQTIICAEFINFSVYISVL